jgi:hypothetical protein
MTWHVPNSADKLRLFLTWGAESYGKHSKDYRAVIEVTPDSGPPLSGGNPLSLNDQLDDDYTDDDSLLIRISK